MGFIYVIENITNNKKPELKDIYNVPRGISFKKQPHI
jgi:hypothetical protein